MGLVPARRPGWLLEGRSDPPPRGMVAHPSNGVDRTRLTGPLAIFLWKGGGEVARTRRSLYSGRLYGQGETIERLGLSPLARIRVSREAEAVRLCDRHGCDEPGDRPAPKSPNSPERWYFCVAHAAEYNRNWNYFEGLSAEDAAAREADEQRKAPTPSPAPSIMAGAARATAAAAATNCARSTCWSWRRTPISRRSRPPSGASPRPITRI